MRATHLKEYIYKSQEVLSVKGIVSNPIHVLAQEAMVFGLTHEKSIIDPLLAVTAIWNPLHPLIPLMDYDGLL